MQQRDASLLVNDKAELSKQLERVYLQFLTREISADDLRVQIRKVFPESLVDPIIEELAHRYHVNNKISRILTDNALVRLPAEKLVLDESNRIDLPKTIKQYYLQQLNSDHPAIQLSYCAIFGFTEFVTEHYPVLESKRVFFSERNRQQQLTSAFYLSALFGSLEFMQKIWGIAEVLGIQKEMIMDDNFSAVAASRASTNALVNDFMTSCVNQFDLTDEVPAFTDDEMFPFFASAHNIEALIKCWKMPRTPQACLDLLSNKACKVFDDIADDYNDDVKDVLINCLIALRSTGKIVIPDDVWITYFRIAITKAGMSTVMKIWNAIEDDTLKEKLLNETIVIVCDELHLPMLKFILEQAESFDHNPIESENLNFVEELIPHRTEPCLRELFNRSPIFRMPRLH